jgi:hypothetical protein
MARGIAGRARRGFESAIGRLCAQKLFPFVAGDDRVATVFLFYSARRLTLVICCAPSMKARAASIKRLT